MEKEKLFDIIVEQAAEIVMLKKTIEREKESCKIWFELQNELKLKLEYLQNEIKVLQVIHQANNTKTQ